MKRRNLILSGLGITGAFIVGWGVLPARSRMGKSDNMVPTEGDIALNGWIKIAKDGGVVLAMHRSDMGRFRPTTKLRQNFPGLRVQGKSAHISGR